MSAIYYVIKKFAETIQNIYFKDVKVIGSENIPESGPLIICGNHANQFIDPIMIISSVQRQVSYTMAASSFSKPVIGQLAAALKSIPVKRPEDHKVKGTGLVKLISKTQIKGNGTKFVDESEKVGAGWSIMIGNKVIPIKTVVDNENLEIVENPEYDSLLTKGEEKFFVSVH